MNQNRRKAEEKDKIIWFSGNNLKRQPNNYLHKGALTFKGNAQTRKINNDN